MSIQAIAWVFSQEIHPSTAKFVLIALANYIQEDGTAWCAISTISEITSQDRKTVVRALADLTKQGHITDTGERKGATGHIKVYQIRVPDAVLLQMPKQSRFSRQQSRSSHRTVPDTVLNPYKLSVKNHVEKKAKKTEPVDKSKFMTGLSHLKDHIQKLGANKP